MLGQLACASLPLLQDRDAPLAVCAGVSCQFSSQLPGAPVGGLGRWGGDAGVEYPLCAQWYFVLMCPRLLQHENEELRRRLTYVTNKMEAMERELESGQDYLEMELGQNREELEKFKDKFRRYENEKRGAELERSLPPRTPSAGVSRLCPVV